MPYNTTHPLKFDCHNCKKESSYPNTLEQGIASDGAKNVIKRCIHCGIENKIEIPEGWVAKRQSEIFRGIKKD